MRVIAQPLPTTPTMCAPMNPIPTPTVATCTASTQMPVVKFAATSIPVTVYNLEQGKFEGIPYPTGRPQVEENPSIPNCNPSQSEATSNAPTFQLREDNPWPNTASLYESIQSQGRLANSTCANTHCESRKKTEVPPRVAAIPHAMVLPKPQNNRSTEEKCTWGPHCPICRKEQEENHRRLEW